VPWFGGLLPGAAVVVAARRDLARMDAGTMDPGGREATRRARRYSWYALCASVGALMLAALSVTGR
jgi:hypothetical protein